MAGKSCKNLRHSVWNCRTVCFVWSGRRWMTSLITSLCLRFCRLLVLNLVNNKYFDINWSMATIRKTLTVEQKNVVVQLYKENMKQTEIAKLFDINLSTICGIIRHYEIRGDVENRPRSGRPKLSTPRDRWTLLRGVKASRSTPLSDLTNTLNQSRNRSVSRRTVQRVLFQSGYHRRVRQFVASCCMAFSSRELYLPRWQRSSS